MGLNLVHLCGNDGAVHTRHLVIKDHRIHRMRKEQVQTFGPTGRFQDLEAVLLEQQLASDKAVPVVVNAENRCFSPRHLSHPFRPGLVLPATFARMRSYIAGLLKWWAG